jgi:membrane-bound lytic murein transglycosylase D
MPQVFRLTCLIAVAVLTACTTAGPDKVAADAPQLDALYQNLDHASRQYQAAQAQLASGDLDVGREAMRQASAELLEVAGRCQRITGCDLDRVLGSYHALLSQPSGVYGEGYAAELPSEPEAAAADSPVLVDLPDAGRSINLLNGQDMADIIALNGPVKAALVEWLTWMRPNLVTAWEQYQYMRHLMWPEYESAGLPEALLFGILAKESGGRVHAVSRAGAAGPLQFMPATGLRYGLGRVDGFDTRFDPQRATRANVLYLNDRFAELNHNLELALAAYNGGEGRVARLYASTGGKSFWSRDVFSRLPPETRDYVPMVLAAAWLFLHPEDYGLEFPSVNTAPAAIVLERPMSINELAICLGNAGSRDGWFRVLRNLNPRWEAHTVIAAGTELGLPAQLLPDYQLNCRGGGRSALAADLAAARKPSESAVAASASAGSYTVQRGDTLAAISRRHGCAGAVALARANGIQAPKFLIKPGQKLQLSGCRG